MSAQPKRLWTFERKRSAAQIAQRERARQAWKEKAREIRLSEDYYASPPPQGTSPVSAAGERRIWCRRYAECVNYVARENWSTFSCNACPVVDEETRGERLMKVISMRHGVDIAVE